jgi:hypothetical protein
MNPGMMSNKLIQNRQDAQLKVDVSLNAENEKSFEITEHNDQIKAVAVSGNKTKEKSGVKFMERLRATLARPITLKKSKDKTKEEIKKIDFPVEEEIVKQTEEKKPSEGLSTVKKKIKKSNKKRRHQ